MLDHAMSQAMNEKADKFLLMFLLSVHKDYGARGIMGKMVKVSFFLLFKGVLEEFEDFGEQYCKTAIQLYIEHGFVIRNINVTDVLHLSSPDVHGSRSCAGRPNSLYLYNQRTLREGVHQTRIRNALHTGVRESES